MPKLEWNELEFLAFFAVEPTVEDYRVSRSYQLERDGLRLLFTLWELESVIQVSLFRGQAEDALFAFAAYVRGEARIINDMRCNYIDFEDCIIAPNRFWSNQTGDPFDQARSPFSVTIRLAIDPDIRISFLNYESRT